MPVALDQFRAHPLWSTKIREVSRCVLSNILGGSNKSYAVCILMEYSEPRLHGETRPIMPHCIYHVVRCWGRTEAFARLHGEDVAGMDGIRLLKDGEFYEGEEPRMREKVMGILADREYKHYYRVHWTPGLPTHLRACEHQSGYDSAASQLCLNASLAADSLPPTIPVIPVRIGPDPTPVTIERLQRSFALPRQLRL